MGEERIRVVIATPGTDGPHRASEALARALRDAGMEVVYAGRQQTAEQIVDAVVQEDADAVGLPVLAGDPEPMLTRLTRLMREGGVDDDVVLFAGGAGPPPDLSRVTRLFPPDTPTAEIAGWLQAQVGAPDRRGAAGELPPQSRSVAGGGDRSCGDRRGT